jgi:peptidoglycan/xylan/chitin deacetylase (PgdA/CDA1 family)
VRHIALSASGLIQQLTGRTEAALQKPRVQILILHHIFPEEEAPFRRMLQFLANHHTFISYSEAVQRIETGQIGKPFITLTFDDGFKNCVRAAEIMNEFGARGCFFICPPIIGETNRDRIAAFCRDRLQLPITVDFMDWDDLSALKNAGHDIGGHTMTHANLARLSPSEARDEISKSFNVIQQRLGEVRHFAWTFGGFSDFTPDAAKAVYECGYTSCAAGVRGAHVPHQQPVQRPCIRRDHVVAASPLAHLTHFLVQSSRRMTPANNDWPQGWNI